MVDITIATVRKNSREELRVGLSEFNGHQLTNLRVFFRTDNGDMRPGKAGLAIRVSMLPAVIEALQETETEARRRGLIDGGSG